jgi:uncharacterized protein YegL
MDEMRFRQQDLLDNPTNRVPVALCLDVSDSMTGDRINELNGGVRQFFEALRADPVAQASAEVAIVAFADQSAVYLDFQGVDRVRVPPELSTRTHLGYQTNLGAGVNLAIDILEARKRDYQSAGVDYFQPFLVLMTDGQPTTNEHVEASARVLALEERKKLVVMPIGIGTGADMNVLGLFSKKNQPLRLKGLAFGAFFQWLSASIVRVSQSRPGERIELDFKGVRGWGSI